MGLPGRSGVPGLTVLVRELAWALGRMGRRHPASVLIGAGNGNLSVDDAVAGWIRGVKHSLTGAPEETQIKELTFVEHHPGRVIVIDSALRAHREQLVKEHRMILHYEPLTERRRAALRVEAQAWELERRWREQQEK
jgi:hypothetical protein